MTKKRFYAPHGETTVIRVPVSCLKKINQIITVFKKKCKKDKKALESCNKV